MFYSTVKDGKTGDNCEKLDGNIALKITWSAKTFGTISTWKSWVIITTIVWKQMFCY